jgi:hypothetical protein
VKNEKLSDPCSHTGVGGLIGASMLVAAQTVTPSVVAVGSHCPAVWSPRPVTSGEKRASAVAESPCWRVIRLPSNVLSLIGRVCVRTARAGTAAFRDDVAADQVTVQPA